MTIRVVFATTSSITAITTTTTFTTIMIVTTILVITRITRIARISRITRVSRINSITVVVVTCTILILFEQTHRRPALVNKGFAESCSHRFNKHRRRGKRTGFPAHMKLISDARPPNLIKRPAF